MTWLLLGILATAAFSILNILDRKFLGELNIHPVVFPAVATTLGTVFTFLFTLILIGVPEDIPSKVIIYGIIIGIFNFSSSSFFYWSLSKAPVSKVIALDRIKIIISLVIAVIFFGETFYWYWVPGVVLIFVGNFLLMKNPGKKSINWEKGAILMLLAGFIGGFQIIPEKIGVEMGLPILVAAIASATRSTGYITTALLFRRQHFKPFWQYIKKLKWGSILVFRSFCSASGWVCFYYALDLGLISKIIPLMQLRLVFAVIMASIFLSEKETKTRLFATIVITIGALLIII